MRRHLVLRRAGAALTLPLVLALTSCADDTESDTAQGAESSSSDQADGDADEKSGGDGKTAGADGDAPAGTGGDAPAALTAEPGESVSSKDFTALMEKAFDTATTARIAMSSGDKNGMSANGQVDYTTKTPSMQLTMRGGGAGTDQEMDVRLVGGAMYMNMGMTGGKFVKFSLGDSAAGSPVDPNQLDPSLALKQFEKSADKITYRGEEKVDGEDLKRFTLVLDPAKSGDYDADVLKSMPKQISLDVWFDDDSHFRQVKQDMGELGTTTVTYSDWGKPVKITVPPKDQIIEQPTMPNAPGDA